MAKKKSKKTPKKAEKEQLERMELENQDKNFAFIAGYTTGGIPYGMMWDELDEEGLQKFGYNDFRKDNLPDDLPF